MIFFLWTKLFSFLFLIPQGELEKTASGSRGMERKVSGQGAQARTQQGAAGCLSLAERAVHQRLRRTVAMVMDQPKKGLGSKLLDMMVLKSAHY